MAYLITTIWSKYLVKPFRALRDSPPLYILTFPYYVALRKNTLDLVNKILDEHNDAKQDALLKRLLRKKHNESRYVQVAGAVLFASVISCLSWDGISDLHWSARALFYSSIIFALVSVVSGAQQQWALPAEKSLKAGSVESEQIKRLLKDHKTGLVFALQCPLMFFAYSVVTFLSGIYAVIFSPLARNGSWGDDTKIATLFSVVNVFVITAFYFGTHFIYQIQPSQ